MSTPSSAFVLAGVASGVGKTSLALALTHAFKRRGSSVQTFKVGPDYLDPTWLSLVSGRPCYNLDGWMMGSDYVRAQAARHPADVQLIEGVMGLFDGASADSIEGSTAEVVLLTNLPVVLVVNAASMAGSIAALVKGYVEFCPDLRFAGIIANQVGSERHAGILRDALAAANLPPLLGAIPKGALPTLPERHLGLVTAFQDSLPTALRDELADACEAHLDLSSLLQHTQCTAKASSDDNVPDAFSKARVGYAFDQAFHFYYADNLDCLRTAGAELIPFSPMADDALPVGLNAVILGGGYPEAHAEALANNESMRRAIHGWAASGHPLHAECGGLMYLADALETLDGSRHAMCGVLPVTTRMLSRRKRLGLTEVQFAHDSLWGRRGECIRGHEFHYSEMVDGAPPPDWRCDYRLQYRRSESSLEEGYANGGCVASYVHLHWASRPNAVRRFLSLAEES